MKKRMAAVGLTVGLAGGGVAGVVFTGNSPIAIAQDGGASSTVPADGTANGNTATNPTPDNHRPDRGQKLAETLKPLVDDNTITQAQADKVIAAIEAAEPKGGPGGPGGRGGFGFGGAGLGRGANLDSISSVLGITTDELTTELKAGKSIATIAQDKGVDVQKVIDAATAKVKERLDAQVTDKKLTQDEADKRLVEATAQITKFVNGELPAMGDHPGGHGGWGGHGGPGGPGNGNGDNSSSTTTPTSTPN